MRGPCEVETRSSRRRRCSSVLPRIRFGARRRERGGADDQGPKENRGCPRGPPHANRMGGSRARRREASGPPPSSRSEAVSGLSRVVAIPLTEDLIAFSPLPPGNRDGIPPPSSLQRLG